MFCRDLHHDCYILVCSQHHAGILWPVLSGDKVSQYILHQCANQLKRSGTIAEWHKVMLPLTVDSIHIKTYVQCYRITGMRLERACISAGVQAYLPFVEVHVWRVLAKSTHPRKKCEYAMLKTFDMNWCICSWNWNVKLLCFRPYPYQPTSRGHAVSTVVTSHTVPSNYGRNAYVWEVIL